MDAKNKYNAQKRIIERRIRKENRIREKKLRMKEVRQQKKQENVQDLQINLTEKPKIENQNDNIEMNEEKKQQNIDEQFLVTSTGLMKLDLSSKDFNRLEIKNDEDFIKVEPKAEIEPENSSQNEQQKPLQFDLVSPSSDLAMIFSPMNGNSFQIPTPSSMIYATPRSQSYFQFPPTPSEYFKNASFYNSRFVDNNKKIN